MRWTLFKKSLVLGLAAALVFGAACVAPADVEVEVGKSLDISFKADTPGLTPPAIVQAIERMTNSEGQRREVAVRVRRQNDQVEAHLDIWGSDLPNESLAEKLRKELPALSGAEIKEQALSGEVRGTFGEKIGQELLHVNMLDKAEVEAARQQVMQKLASEGVKGKVDVKIEGDEKRKRIEVRVENEDCDPPEENAVQEGTK